MNKKPKKDYRKGRSAFTAYLPDEIKNELDILSEVTKISRTKIIESAIEKYSPYLKEKFKQEFLEHKRKNEKTLF